MCAFPAGTENAEESDFESKDSMSAASVEYPESVRTFAHGTMMNALDGVNALTGGQPCASSIRGFFWGSGPTMPPCMKTRTLSPARGPATQPPDPVAECAHELSAMSPISSQKLECSALGGENTLCNSSLTRVSHSFISSSSSSSSSATSSPSSSSSSHDSSRSLTRQCSEAAASLTYSATTLNLSASLPSSFPSSSPSATKLSHQAIAPCELAKRLTTAAKDILLIDCRSFIAYSKQHIAGALNISCSDHITKRRLKCGKIKLAELVNGQEGKSEFQERSKEAEIVVYDENTLVLKKQACGVTPSPIQIVLNILVKEGYKNTASYLGGGLQSFESHYSEFVEKPEPHEQPKLLFSPTTPDNFNEDIDTAVISEVIPGFLFIGNERDASNWTRLQEVGITHVLNVTAHIPLYFSDRGIQYHRLPASDSCNQNLKQYFTDAIKFLDDVRSSGGKALVHCQAGVSRSATITIAYVMRHSTLNTMDAYRFVKSKRHIVNPNLNFMGQLIGFDTQLDGGEISRTCDLNLGEISVPAE